MQAIQDGDYLRAYDALQRTSEARTMVGVASGAFLLALVERFADAERLLAGANLPAIELIVRGERDRAARARDPRAAGSLAAAISLPFLGIYAGFAVALLQRDEALAERIKADAATHVRPVAGRLQLASGEVRTFRDLADSDDAIGQMLETYCGNGLLYFPFAALRWVEFLPKTNFMDVLMPKVRIIDRDGGTAMAFVPMLYAGSALSDDPYARSGRMTSFDYVGRARRGRGQRDFVLDGGTLIGIQNVAAIEIGPAAAA